MKLVNVKSAAATATTGLTDFILTVTAADDGSGSQFDIPFTLSQNDTESMSSQVNAWLTTNPNFVIGSYVAPAPTADDVWSEKDRRWALGFDYDFKDSRGIQHINTTPKDLQGWNLVTTAAQVAINAGAPTTQLTIYPDVVGITITAAEWQQILGTAAAFFQAIMSSAVALVATSPIPTDFANDSHWTT